MNAMNTISNGILAFGRFARACGVLALIIGSGLACAQESLRAIPEAMPKPREVTKQDQTEVLEALRERFGLEPGKSVRIRAAGPYRFAGTDGLLYIDRRDLGSFAIEDVAYGTSNKSLATEAIRQENLLPVIEDQLRKARVDTPNRVFGHFDDEFAGAVLKQEAGRDFDPRSVSLHVARTASFDRVVDAIPVFGSELIVGLNQDGTIGRLRVHWPRLDPKLVDEALALRDRVQRNDWQLPAELRNDDTEILDVSAGVGHSGFADPGFRSAAVIRVLFRKSTRGLEYPVSSTGYKFYTAEGREIRFNVFPKVAGSPASVKVRQAK
jgi:hypothetical protein